MFFTDRAHAGQLLSEAIRAASPDLNGFIVTGLARGGVVVGAPIAEEFQIPLVSLLVDDFKTPTAVYFVSGYGQILEYPHSGGKQPIFHQNGDNLKEVEGLAAFVQTVVERHLRYNNARLQEVPRKVLLVDDGLVSGSTALAAIQFLRAIGVEKIILAIPVLPSWFTKVEWDFKYLAWRNSTMRKPSSGIFYKAGGFGPTPDEEVSRLTETLGL